MATGKLSARPSGKNSGESPKKAPRARGAKVMDRYAESQGAGGETHQTADGNVPTLTTQQGIPVADDQNTLRYGPRGPALLEDAHFRE
jgi:catalase